MGRGPLTLMFLGLNLKNAGLVGAIASAFAGLKQIFATGNTVSLGNAIPVGAKQLVAKAWGAGGAGIAGGAGDTTGGGGGFVTASYVIDAGYTFDYWVGNNSGGGALSGVRIKNSTGTTIGWILSPGGGGGGASDSIIFVGGNGGGGGGTTGGAGSPDFSGGSGGGGGGTAGAGGTGGTSSSSGPGSDGQGPFTTDQSFNGGPGGSNDNTGGNGGGGYFGGGGGGSGTNTVAGGAGGGGGSLFVSGSTSTANESGSGAIPGGTTDPDYASPAGTGGVGAAGGAGRLVLIWS